MIDLRTVIALTVGVMTVGGAIIAFFQMQTRQNMKIEILQAAIKKLEQQHDEQTHSQIETEKAITEINTKLDHIVKTLDEIRLPRSSR